MECPSFCGSDALPLPLAPGQYALCFFFFLRQEHVVHRDKRMVPQLPKSLLLTAIFVAISLLIYLSYHNRSFLRSNSTRQYFNENLLATDNGSVSLPSNEDQCRTYPTNFTDHSIKTSSSLLANSLGRDDDVSLEKHTTSKILQAVMLAGDLDTQIFERMLSTHMAHGKHWGYETRILRRFIRGHGKWKESIFSKPLYVLQLLTTEMGKPEEERAEWIV